MTLIYLVIIIAGFAVFACLAEQEDAQ